MSNGFLKPYEIERIKSVFSKGTRVELDSMDDPYAPIPSGTQGTVEFVDDAGQIHMSWDNGRSLALIYGEDSFHIIKEQENTIKVLVVEPMKAPYVKEIENDYKAMRKIVEGDIEFVGLDSECHLYCNDEGKINGFEGNRRMDNGDVICGTFFICSGDGLGNDTSLNQSQIDRFSERFKELESYRGIDFSNPPVTITTYDTTEEFLNALKGFQGEDFER